MYDIYHSGIKGQRKGVRRFQYANKTYTPAGNERYRPKKGAGAKVASAAITAASSLALLNAFNATTGLSTIMATSLSNVASNIVLLGAEVAAGFAAVPIAAYALTVPMAIMTLPIAVQNGRAYIENKKFEKSLKKTLY